jgi:hypothetical protein
MWPVGWEALEQWGDDVVRGERAVWEAAVCWDPSGTDQFALRRLAEVRAI